MAGHSGARWQEERQRGSSSEKDRVARLERHRYGVESKHIQYVKAVKEEEEEEETLFDPKSTNVQITIPHISDIQFKQ